MPTRLLLAAVVLLLALVALVLHWSGADGSAPPVPASAASGNASPEPVVAPLSPDARAAGSAAEGLQRTAIATGSERSASLHLTGRVVDAAGQPVPDQPLELLAAKPPANSDPRIQFVGNRSRDFTAAATTTTGSDGTFALAPPAGLALRLRPTGERRVFRQGPIELEPSAVDLSLGDIVAQTACSIDGSVRDGTGRAIAGAELRCGANGRWFDEANARKTVSAADGSFHFGGLDNGAFLVRVRAEGFGPQQRAATLQPEHQLRGCDFELATGGSIEGRVVDERDAPVAGASVSASSNAGPDTPPPAPVQSGADGSFTLNGLTAPSSLRASKSGYRRANLDDVAIGRRDVVLRLQRMAMLAGNVVDAQDAPVVGSRVRAVPAGQSPDQDRISALFDAGVVTDAEGHFALPNPASGLYRVIASGDHLDAVVAGVQVVQGQACAPLRIVVDRGGAARFTIVDPAGAPVAGAKVRVVDAGAPDQQRPMIIIGGGGGGLDPDDFAAHRVWKASTDAQGACTVRGLRSGSWRVTVEAAAFVQPAPAQFAVGTGTVDVAVALAAAGFADVAVLGRDGVPLPGRRVEVEGPLGAKAERQLSVTADAAGKARVGPLLPGRWAAALGKTLDHEALGGGVALVTSGSGPVHRGTRVEFAVEAGGTADVRLVQPELSTLRGTLLGADGAIADGSVQVQREETDPQGQTRFGLDGSARSTHTRPDGSFAIADLEPGRYRVRFGRQQQAMKAERAVEMPAGQPEVPVELRLACGGLRVRVVRGEGGAVAGAQATLRRDGDPPPAKDPGIRDFAFDSAPTAQARSDGEGVATFADLPEGRYVVDVKAAHCLPASSGTVAVAAGDPGAVAVTLRPAAWIAGTVVDAAGGEVAQAQVEWRAAAQAAFTAVPVSSGRFEIDGLEPGDYVLRARRTGRSATVAAPAFGEEYTVRVDVTPGPPVQLRVPD